MQWGLKSFSDKLLGEEGAAGPLATLGVLSHFSRVRLFVPPWAVAHQAPLSMEFSRSEYWSRDALLHDALLPDLGMNREAEKALSGLSTIRSHDHNQISHK